jgi:hypothetical protein
LEALKSKGLPYLEALKSKGLPYLEALRNRGATALETLKSKGLPYLQSLKTRGVSALEGLKSVGSTIFSKMSNAVTKVMSSVGTITKSVFGGLKTGFTSLFEFMGKLGGSIGEVLSKIPGMGALKSLGKFALNTAGGLFAGYDFAEGNADAERITGEQRATGLVGTAQGFVGGSLNMGTGFVNSVLDLGTMATGKNMGTVDPKGVYQFLTGTKSEYMGQNIQGKSGLDRMGATASYYLGTNNNINSSSDGYPSSNAMKLASYAGNRNINNKLTGGETKNIKDVLYGAGACYATVWDDIKQTGLNTQGLAPTGDQGSAWQFNIWASTPAGQKQVRRIQVGNGIKNGFIIGTVAGDILVYDKNYDPSTGTHINGHIEIVGVDGYLYSDFKATPQRALKFINAGKVTVYRLNDKSEALKSSIKNTSYLKDTAFNGIVANEGSGNNPTQLRKDDGGFTFGKSQFNSGTNPSSWQKLGFSNSEISNITAGNFNKSSVQSRLNSQSDKINQMDNQNKDELFNWALSFGKKNNIDISNPIVFGNIMDIGNQFNKGDIGSETASKLVNYSGSRKITPDAVMQWRNQTLQARKNPNYKQDQSRRFNNMKKAVTAGIVAGTMGIAEASSGANMSSSRVEEFHKVHSYSNNSKYMINDVETVKLKEKLGTKRVEQIQAVLKDPIAKQIVLETMINQPSKKTDLSSSITFGDSIFKNSNEIGSLGLSSLTSSYDKPLYQTKDIRSLVNNKNVNSLTSLGRNVMSLSKNLNLSNGLNLGNSLIQNKGLITDLTASALSPFGVDGLAVKDTVNTASQAYTNARDIYSGVMGGNLTKEALSKFDIAIPTDILKAGNTVIQNKSALGSVGNSVMSAINNPTDIWGGLSKVGGSLLQNTDGLGKIAGSISNIFTPKTVTQSDVLLQTNQDMMTAKELTQPQPIVIPMQSQQQQSSQNVISKSMNINDMYLMTLVSGVFD